MSTLKTTNLQHASAASPAIVLAADGTATAQLSSINGGPLAGARNRIINGDMRIDQRNAGASVNVTSSSLYITDRWVAECSPTSKFSGQRSTVAPTGFSNSLLITTTSAHSPSGGDYAGLRHNIEGFNTAGLGWGSAGASAVTLSFWVRSSLTGTFSGSLRNSGDNRSYVFSYTINAANTWEYKAIAIAGDTSGSWLVDNGLGISAFFNLGTGSTFSTTAGSWTAGNFVAATASTSVVATNGATFYLTGVQLEAGSVATPFERRSYGQELALCQRYFAKIDYVNLSAYQISGNGYGTTHPFPVEMRASPTVTKVGTWYVVNSGQPLALVEGSKKDAVMVYAVASSSGVVQFASTTSNEYLTASAEL